jgi:carboxylesterase type B
VDYLNAEGISTISWESLPRMRDLGAAETIWSDAKVMFQWVKENAAKYNLDPDRIIIGGHSRGTAASWQLAHSLDPAIHDQIKAESPPIMITYWCTPENTQKNIHDPKYGLAVEARYKELGNGKKVKIIHSVPYETLYDYVVEFCKSVL